MLRTHRWPWDHDGSVDNDPAFGSFNQPQYTILPSSGTGTNGKPIYSWDQAASQITREWPSVGWNGALGTSLTISYAFRSTAPAQMPDGTSGFSRFSSAQIVATQMALQQWAEVSNITFIQVTGPGGSAYSNSATILFSNYSAGSAGAAAFAFLAEPGHTTASDPDGDVWVNSSLPENQSFNNLDYGAQVLLHEIGHALGLEHPGDYNAGPNVSPTYDADAVYWQDTRMFTVMSYFGSVNTGGSLPGLASGPQLHDIAAIQRLYGANTNTRTGDTVYGFNSNTGEAHFSIASGALGAVFSIWDAGGNDTLDLSGYSTNSNIDLRPESFTSAGPGDATSPISTDALYNISIARGVTIENAIGGSGNDTITGNDVANVLTGNAGDDTLFGGAGVDTANYASASTSDSWHRNPDGSWTIVAGGEGTDTLTGVEFAHFTDRDVFLARAAETFTGDGASDLFLRNSAGTLSVWFLNGASITGAGAGSISAAWSTLGYGDLNGDGRDDILWRDSSGNLALWYMNGAAVTGNGLGNVGAAWSVAGIGDLNGDLKDDIVWRNTNGDINIWFMNGTAITGASLGNVSPDWTIETMGDFNGDGKQDFLWRNTVSGDMSVWFMNGTAVTGGQFAHVAQPWVVEGTGDFNGDGRDDVMWRNSATGDVSLWFMDNSTIAGSAGFSVGASWHVGAIGDYNGDGKDDILWWNDNGALVEWLMNGGAVTANALGALDHDWIINPGG